MIRTRTAIGNAIVMIRNSERVWRIGILILPGSDFSRIDVDKARTRIVTDSSQLQGDGRMPDLVEWDAGDGDVNSLTDTVEAMSGDMSAILHQKRVVGWRAVAGDDVNFVSSPEFLVDKVKILNGIDIHDGYLVGVVAPHDPVYRTQGIKVIRTIRSPKINGEAIICVGVEKCKCPAVGKR